MLVLSINKVVAERYLPAEIWDVTVTKDVSEDKNLVIQNTETISINLADVILTNFHVQITGRNTPDKLAYHSARGIMNNFSLSNTKFNFDTCETRTWYWTPAGHHGTYHGYFTFFKVRTKFLGGKKYVYSETIRNNELSKESTNWIQ